MLSDIDYIESMLENIGFLFESHKKKYIIRVIESLRMFMRSDGINDIYAELQKVLDSYGNMDKIRIIDNVFNIFVRLVVRLLKIYKLQHPVEKYILFYDKFVLNHMTIDELDES